MANDTMIPKMVFIGFDKVPQHVEKFRKAIGELAGNDVIDGMTFVMNETDTGGNALQSCYGVTLSIQELKSDPARKVTLLGWLPLEFIRRKKPEMDFLLGKRNFKFFQLPATPERIISVWRDSSSATFNANVEGIQKYTMRIANGLLHIIHGKDPKENREAPDVQKMLSETKREFPSMANHTDDEIFDFLIDASSARELVREGENLEGVFCDVEGTVLVGDDICEDVLAKLKGFERQGKTVTLWTDGDIDEITTRLRALGIVYPVHAKADFAGACVEIAIDDLDEIAFTARTKILARNFVRVV